LDNFLVFWRLFVVCEQTSASREFSGNGSDGSNYIYFFITVSISIKNPVIKMGL